MLFKNQVEPVAVKNTMHNKPELEIDQPSPSLEKYNFRFHGSATEYFGIWMVNLMLTIITLTLYSPWAKARRIRYFYGNTQLLKHRFDFIAMPSRILLGRLLALELYVVTDLDQLLHLGHQFIISDCCDLPNLVNSDDSEI